MPRDGSFALALLGSLRRVHEPILNSFASKRIVEIFPCSLIVRTIVILPTLHFWSNDHSLFPPDGDLSISCFAGFPTRPRPVGPTRVLRIPALPLRYPSGIIMHQVRPKPLQKSKEAAKLTTPQGAGCTRDQSFASCPQSLIKEISS